MTTKKKFNLSCVGKNISCSHHGKGTIVDIKEDINDYPVICEFFFGKEKYNICYTYEGYYFKDIHVQSIYLHDNK